MCFNARRESSPTVRRVADALLQSGENHVAALPSWTDGQSSFDGCHSRITHSVRGSSSVEDGVLSDGPGIAAAKRTGVEQLALWLSVSLSMYTQAVHAEHGLKLLRYIQ